MADLTPCADASLTAHGVNAPSGKSADHHRMHVQGAMPATITAPERDGPEKFDDASGDAAAFAPDIQTPDVQTPDVQTPDVQTDVNIMIGTQNRRDARARQVETITTLVMRKLRTAVPYSTAVQSKRRAVTGETMSRNSERRNLRGIGAAACWLGVAVVILAAGAANAQTPAQCEYPANLATDTQIRVGQLKGRALVEITRPNSAGRKVEVEYGEELYSQKFGPDGRVRVGFALTAPTNTFLVTMSETKPITCTVNVPDFNKLYRAVLRWRDPVQLDLNVIEPGARTGETGHVNGSRPNGNLTQGIGQMDIVSGVPTEGATAEISYVVTDVISIPQNSVFSYRLDYVTRGTQPEPPYCDDGPLAAPQFEFITIENGVVNTRKMSTNHARCREKISDSRRLMLIR